jgi:hypothetical protein
MRLLQGILRVIVVMTVWTVMTPPARATTMDYCEDNGDCMNQCDAFWCFPYAATAWLCCDHECFCQCPGDPPISACP